MLQEVTPYTQRQSVVAEGFARSVKAHQRLVTKMTLNGPDYHTEAGCRDFQNGWISLPGVPFRLKDRKLSAAILNGEFWDTTGIFMRFDYPRKRADGEICVNRIGLPFKDGIYLMHQYFAYHEFDRVTVIDHLATESPSSFMESLLFAI